MRRRALLATTGALLGATGTAGCLADGTSATGTTTKDDTETITSTTSTTETPTSSTDSRTSTDDYVSTEEASNTPDPDHDVLARNEDDERHEMTVRIDRTEDGERVETVHESTLELDPGSVDSVYNLREANPDGIQAFEVTASVGDRTESVTLRTSMCYGDLELVVDESGELRAIYAIC